MFFTQNQVLEEVVAVQTGQMSEDASVVFQGWCEVMEAVCNNGEIDLRNGFRGFYQRFPREILFDLNSYNRLNIPLKPEQIDEVIDEKVKYSTQYMPDHVTYGTLAELSKEYGQQMYVGWNFSKPRTDTMLIIPFNEERCICHVWNNPNQRLNLIHVLQWPTHG